MIIVLTGSTGLVGRALVRRLLRQGHQVRALVRDPLKVWDLPAAQVYRWSDSEVPPAQALRGADAVIHLAGEKISGGRWTGARKKRLWDSRVEGANQIVKGLSALPENERPSAFISASAIGYYGEGGEQDLDENSSQGSGFLADLCAAWEGAALKAESLGLRCVRLRFGVVLSNEGGVLAQSGPFVIGRGRQWLSWVHIDDVVGILEWALTSSSAQGVFNVVAPTPVQQKEFAKTLVRTLKYPTTIPVPGLALKLALGEFSSAVLGSQKVMPIRLVNSGYTFRFTDLSAALSDLFRDMKYRDSCFVTSQFVDRPRDEVFPFFSRAENLETLTPSWLGFHIVHQSTPEIEAGTLIDYKLRIRGVPVRWRTLIQEWKPPQEFVDEQLRGPYRRWHHIHRFDSVPGGTLLTDKIIYRVPGSLLGHTLFGGWIGRDVAAIFNFRQRKIAELFRK